MYEFLAEARAKIGGEQIRYLTPNSTLHLECQVHDYSEAPEFIFWYHERRMINYDSDRGIDVSTRTGIYLVPTKHLPSLLTEINFLINHCKYVPNNILIVSIAEFAYSELLIRRAGQQHSGNYSCVPSNALPTAVTVHIFTGKWRPTHSPTEAVPTLLLLYSCVPYQSVSVSLLLKGKSSSAYDLPHEILRLCSRHN